MCVLVYFKYFKFICVSPGGALLIRLQKLVSICLQCSQVSPTMFIGESYNWYRFAYNVCRFVLQCSQVSPTLGIDLPTMFIGESYSGYRFAYNVCRSVLQCSQVCPTLGIDLPTIFITFYSSSQDNARLKVAITKLKQLMTS